MAKGLIGEKIGMTQVFDSEGNVSPVTILRVGPCAVSQVKTQAKDGYDAVQLAFDSKKEKVTTKAEKGHLARAGIDTPKKVLREFRDYGQEVNLGSELKATDVFQINDLVKISGITKGKGFQGVVRRHGFAGGPKTHGSRFQRHGGASGAGTTPGRIFKGKKMGGRMGSDSSTVRNLKVLKINESENIIFVSGNIPGNNTSVITIEKL